ncbi:MAG TPA: YdeI/OmpD-associated family protein [Allosphingosinicella sp.]|nr:YdeI/OmpD-associated family protein [Allosphingosinicella sp.]
MSTDPRIDAYIARQADFARPILEHLRSSVHAACPEAEETLKWGMPHFLYKGQLLVGMAAFKAHSTFGFWRAKEVLGETGAERDAMGQFGRLASVADLPPDDVLHALIRKAMALTDAGARPARSKAEPKAEAEAPPEFETALSANPAAQATFDGFPPSCRREYVEWVVQAKKPETRDRRIAQAVEWMAEGKRRNWKYENC